MTCNCSESGSGLLCKFVCLCHQKTYKNNQIKIHIFLRIIDNIRDIEEVKGYGPTPILSVGVRQAGTLIDDELRVKPGTPLNMEVFLDSVSADVYGLMVTGMDVTDTGNQVEPILVNG